MKLSTSQNKIFESFRQTNTKILYLRDQFPDVSQGEIARHMKIIPQHVSNVIRNQSRNPKETFIKKNKKSIIIN